MELKHAVIFKSYKSFIGGGYETQYVFIRKIFVVFDNTIPDGTNFMENKKWGDSLEIWYIWSAPIVKTGGVGWIVSNGFVLC